MRRRWGKGGGKGGGGFVDSCCELRCGWWEW